MGARNYLAFLQQFLTGVAPASAPQEVTALENEAFGRLVTAGWTTASAGTLGNTNATDGQLLIGKTSDHSLNLATLTAGSNVTITNGAGAVTIAATSGGGTVTHTAGALTASALVVGAGAADIDVLASLGTTTTVLHGNAAGRPTFGALTLTTDVTGTLPVANGGTGVATATVHGVMIGNAASAQNTTAAGSIGTVLTGMGAADPTFQPLSNATCQGRLTLTTAVPVTTTDVTGATTIYFTPYGGNGIALYDGSNGWKTITFAETSLALGTLTSGLPYDVFGFLNGSTLNTELLAWTSTTARATALALQDGVLSKTGALTRRYLGTFYTTSTTATEDSNAKRFVWNYYNRVVRKLKVVNTSGTHTYSSATKRQYAAGAGNQLDLVSGYSEDALSTRGASFIENSSGVPNGWLGVGEDSTSSPHADTLSPGAFSNGSAEYGPVTTALDVIPAVGRHFYALLEWTSGSGTTIWQDSQSGITGIWRA